MAAPRSLIAIKAEARADALSRRGGWAGVDLSPVATALARLIPRGVGVSAFLSLPGEVDTAPVLAALSAAGLRLLLPVTTPRGNPLIFRHWEPDRPLTAGPFGTRHPAEGEAMDPDWLLVPLLAFDRRGHRLGYGGGYYDRTLAALRARRPIVAVGLAPAAAEMDAVPAGPYDARLDGVATERGVRWFGD